MFNDAFVSESSKPQDIIISALKHLGGVGHLSEIAAQCAEQGNVIPEPSIRRLLQAFSTDADWSKSSKPKNAADLYYSVDGTDKKTGFWGLRGFAVDNPQSFPVPGLKRAYTTLLERAETPFRNVRGIGFYNGVVEAIQVGFAPNSPYPDKLLPDGRIEHIGEGSGPIQSSSGGNGGMIAAIKSGGGIPIFQSVGPKGKKRYAYLGVYIVASFEKRVLTLSEKQIPTDAYVFTLEPTISTTLRNDFAPLTSSAAVARGGFETPIIREIPDTAPTPSTKKPTSTDAEARRQEIERRIASHHSLLIQFKKRATAAGFSCVCDQYADALCDGNIFEIKTIETDAVAQVRAAVGQLYHYKFIHRNLDGFEHARLFAVFDADISPSLKIFLRDEARIGAIFFIGGKIEGDHSLKKDLPWLF